MFLCIHEPLKMFYLLERFKEKNNFLGLCGLYLVHLTVFLSIVSYF